MRWRLLTGLAFLAVLAASATPALAAGGFNLTPRSGDQFPTRTYLLTLPPGKTAGTGTLHVTENGGPVAGLTVTPLTDTSTPARACAARRSRLRWRRHARLPRIAIRSSRSR
jgi:hypothetical protein